jgi:hypothetical protein
MGILHWNWNTKDKKQQNTTKQGKRTETHKKTNKT